MRVETKIEPKSLADFDKALTEYAYGCRETMRDVGLKNAALMCRESMMLTPPMGNKGNGLKVQAQKAGEKTINRDVRKIFTAVNGKGTGPLLLVTQQLAYTTRYGSPSDFRSLLEGARVSALKKGTRILQAIANDYDDERAFKKAKNYLNRSIARTTLFGTGYVQDLRTPHENHLKRFNGRFLIGGKSVNPLRNWRDKLLVQDNEAIKDYVASRTPSVGKLKSGWYKVLMSLPKPSSREDKSNFGTSGIAPYITRHAGNAGYVNLADTKDVFSLVIGNGIADMNKVSTEADVKSTVIGLRVKQLRLDLEQRLKKAADKASKR